MLQVDELPEPTAGPDELLVAVSAAGVTLPAVRALRTATQLPVAPGGDVVGRVAEVGPGVRGWQTGQRVAAIAFAGAYADRVLVQAGLAVTVPEDIDDLTAVALVRGGQVALGALRAGGLRNDTTSVLITAAGGGVGTLAVQLARAAGVERVVAATSSLDKAPMLQALGATETVAYGQRWDTPVDLAVDSVGGPVQAQVIESLAPFGVLVSISATGAAVEVNELRVHGRGVIGFGMAPLARHRPQTYRDRAVELWKLANQGSITPAIDGPYELERAAEAHRRIEERRNHGKLVLTL
ncbi:quinone oxidoreductase family protein [Actinomycetospora soli]|uniref:quinone oxidoreductase family protein n=1 Tax=Actinomycetospora soli TaxID=2893887 RepID=UPI001E4EB15F|nr:zinc-binding dehydrogenase [Actinomycetospora soli]MCD2191693.1 zinc-binding dehydrogenase [Actinomycetospora soli]